MYDFTRVLVLRFDLRLLTVYKYFIDTDIDIDNDIKMYFGASLGSLDPHVPPGYAYTSVGADLPFLLIFFSFVVLVVAVCYLDHPKN